MANPIFPGVEQILDIIMGELPAGVFPEDRADSELDSRRSYSSAELRAHAQSIADLYGTMALTYQDKFITTATADGITAWEKQLFIESQNSALPIETRRQNLLSKYRASGGISLPAIQSVVDGILTPLGLPFEIIPYSGQSNGVVTGAWILDVSALDVGTFLSSLDPLRGAGRDPGIVPLDCDGDYAAAGLTLDEYRAIQETAYRYEVRIYGVASAETLALLNKQLTALEPARSDHTITNDAPTPMDPDVLDFGPPGSDAIVESIDFGEDAPVPTYDVWNFGVMG